MWRGRWCNERGRDGDFWCGKRIRGRVRVGEGRCEKRVWGEDNADTAMDA